jgi:hypothetical protein
MTEDSGAFKTNRANSDQVPSIVMIRAQTVAAKPHQASKSVANFAEKSLPPIFSKRCGSLALSSVEP